MRAYQVDGLMGGGMGATLSPRLSNRVGNDVDERGERGGGGRKILQDGR
jgi:hypothetical protein